MTEFVEEGKVSASIAQNPYDMGYLSVAQAHKVINGVHIEKKTDSGIDIITQDNAKQRLNFYKRVLRWKTDRNLSDDKIMGENRIEYIFWILISI